MIGKLKSIMKKKLAKVIAIVLVLAIAFSALVAFDVIELGSKKTAVQQQRTSKVKKGDISITVTGSGAIASSNRVDITPKVSGTITKVYFKEGDTVKEGDLLFEMDDKDAKLNLEEIKTNMEKAAVSSNSSIKSVNNLNVTAPFGGKITKIESKVGDTLGKNASILTITDMSRLKVVLPFSGSAVKEISNGKKATVYIQDLMQSVGGTVTYVSSSPYSTSLGGEVYDVEISINNPGSLKEGMKAAAGINTSKGEVTSTDAGSTEYINTETIKSDAGGTVNSINVRVNDTVKAGDLLAQIDNDDLAVAVKTNELEMKGLNSKLESAQDKISNYKIYSPINGVIVSQDANAGDMAKEGSALATISDTNNMEFDVSIDELDIAKIKVGQEVNITADALTETEKTPLTGEVTKVAIEGTSSNGVTTYPVTIKVNETEKLKVGMNVNAEIMTSQKKDVLLVPLEAVTKVGNGGIVFVMGTGDNSGNKNGQGNRDFAPGGFQGGNDTNGDASGNGRKGRPSGAPDGVRPSGAPGGAIPSGAPGNVDQKGTSERSRQGASSGSSSSKDSSNNAVNKMMKNSAYAKYYENAVVKRVELGINNDSYIEVVSGLDEGDEVLLPPLSTGSSSGKTQTQMGGMGGIGGMGGFSGGMGGPPNMGGNRSGGSQQRSSGSSQQKSSGSQQR